MTTPTCPITQLPLRDPWMDPEGNTYEREAILQWLSTNDTSPITRTPLTAQQLVPNRALKDLIDAAAQQLKVSRPPVPTTSTSDGDVPAVRLTVRRNSQSSVTQYTIAGPETGPLRPCHICCVIDVSGSMSTEATIKTESGGTESDGLTLLDIVKHATRTIIESLGAGDMCSVVAFSSESNIVLQPTVMDAAGKSLAHASLLQLAPNGSTNLAAGVRHGVQVATGVGPRFFSAVFVLTDGVPSDPNLDYTGALKRQLAREKPLYGSVHTFGFGYSLDSSLLKSIAVEGDGAFAFIPDAGMVGTVFINALSNVRTVYATPVSLKLPKTRSLALLGEVVRTTDEPEHVVVRLPPLRYGQPVTLVVQSDTAPEPVTLRYYSLNANRHNVVAEVASDLNEGDEFYHSTRTLVARALFRAAAAQSLELAKPDAILTPDAEFLRRSAAYSPLQALQQDLEGQVKAALSKPDWFQRWGRHYLISLAFAHLHQSCNNFKDAGVQVYGGALFKKLQAELNDLFMTLPAPTPSGYRGTSGRGGSGAYSGPPAPVDMSRYNNSSGVCFHPHCLIEMMDGQWEKISNLKRGMRVRGGSTVHCVIETCLAASGGAWFSMLAGQSLLTPYHPVRRVDFSGDWKFPIDISPPKFVPCDSVYNLVLTNGPNMVRIAGYDAVTLGHNLGGNVVQHDYFGTDQVIDDLKACPGWADGHVCIQPEQIIRNYGDGPVAAIVAPLVWP